MRYPELVPDWVCTTPISLAIEAEEINEDGAPSFTEVEGLLCNYQDGGKALFQAEQKVVDVSGLLSYLEKQEKSCKASKDATLMEQ